MISFEDKYKFVKALPKGFRYAFEPTSIAFDELPGEILWRLCPPDTDYIKKSRGFLKGSYVVAEYDVAYDQIYLYEEYYDQLLPVFSEALEKLGLKWEIVKGNITRTENEFLDRLGANSSYLAYWV